MGPLVGWHLARGCAGAPIVVLAIAMEVALISDVRGCRQQAINAKYGLFVNCCL